MKRETLDRVQDLLNEMVETSYVAGVSCMILEQGKEQGYYQAGYADLSVQKAVTRDTIYLLYSMTKPVTAAAVMILMEEGRLDLLEPVEKYIPGFKNQQVEKSGQYESVNRAVTIKDLLSMTSGLVYDGEETPAQREMQKLFEDVKEKLLTEEAYTTLEVANKIGRNPLQFQPGEHWEYGTSADILGAVVECVSGKRFGEFLEERIFKPLGMKDTGFYVPDEKKYRLSKVYEEIEGELKEYHDNRLGIMIDMPKYPSFESGGAGLVSTIDDYAKFAAMLLNRGEYEGKRILAPKTVDYMTSCKLNEIQQKDLIWDNLPGHTYGNLMRVMVDSGLAVINGTNGEYGWDGWLGPYFSNDPKHQVTILLMQQRAASGTTSYTRKLRNIVASAME